MPGMTFYGVSVLAFGFPGFQMSCIGLQELCFQAKMSPPTWRETEEIGCESMGYRKTTIKIRLWWLQKKCSHPTVCVVIFLFRISSFDYGLNNPWFIGVPWDIYYSPCGKECYLLVTPSLTEQFQGCSRKQQSGPVFKVVQLLTSANLSDTVQSLCPVEGLKRYCCFGHALGSQEHRCQIDCELRDLADTHSPHEVSVYFMLCRKN